MERKLKRNLAIQVIKDHNITTIEVIYSGGGDDGCIDEVNFTDHNEEAVTYPFNKEIEFQKIQNDFCDFGQAKILPDVPKVPVVEKLFYLFFTNIDKLNKPVAQSLDDLETVKREHLVILYFESALYDLYKNRNLKRDSGLYYHTEEYIQACLKPYIKEILFKYKHRVRDDTFVLRDRLYSQYYVLLV